MMSSTESNYPLHVAYDAQAFVMPDRGTGKGTQLRNFLGSYIRVFTGLAPENEVSSELPLTRQGRSRYLVWQQLSLPRLLFRTRPDVFLAPYNTSPLVVPRRTKVVLVLHDLILLERFPGTPRRQALFNSYRGLLIGPSVARASMVLTVSEYSRQEILKRFPRANVKVIPNTIAESWFTPEDVIPIEKKENFILMVTATPPHKNVNRALQSYAAYVSQQRTTAARLRVVGISGMADAYGKMARDLGVGDLVRFEPYLAEHDLQDLYRKANALLFPSLMEGFGIPVLEAMACGTPVICSNTTSLPEVGGDAAVYFDPKDVTDIAATLVRVLENRNLQKVMVQRGFVQAERYRPAIVREMFEDFWKQLPDAIRPRRSADVAQSAAGKHPRASET